MANDSIYNSSSHSGRSPRLAFLCAAALLIFLLCPLGTACALPILADKLTGSKPLADVASYLYSPNRSMDVNAANSALMQDQYRRLADGMPMDASGVYWLRFSIIDDSDATAGAPLRNIVTVLNLGQDAPTAAAYIADETDVNGEVRRWTRFTQQPDGTFRITLKARNVPMTVYVRLDSVPGLNFVPVLMAADTADNTFTFPTTGVANAFLLIGLVVGLVRLSRLKEQWRAWSCALTAILLLAGFTGAQGFEPARLELTSLLYVLAPGIALVLYPHIGSFLLGGAKAAPAKPLAVLSLLGVLTALLPLLPGLGWLYRLTPLAPLLLFPLLLLTLARVKNSESGALPFALACLFPLVGAVLYGVGIFLGMPALAAGLPMLGYGFGAIALAAAKPLSARVATEDHFPLNNLLTEHSNLFGASEGSDLLSGMSGGLSSLMDSAKNNRNNKQEAAADLPFSRETAPGQAATTIFTDEPTVTHRTSSLDELPLLAPAKQVEQPTSHSFQQALSWEVADTTPPPAAPSPAKADAESVMDLTEPLTADIPDKPLTIAPDAPARNSAKPAEEHDEVLVLQDTEEPGLIILKPVSEDGEEPLEVQDDPRNAVLRQAERAHMLRQQEQQERDEQADYLALARVESALRATYDNIVQTLDELKHSRADSQNILDGVGTSINGLGSVLNNMGKIASGEINSPREATSVFNLMRLVRSVHAQNLETAEAKGVTLSWFIAPSLPSFFIGHAEALHSALIYLLQGTVENAEAGSVQLAVRPVEDDPEAIRFTLLDSSLSPESARAERMSRPASWISKAWELSGMEDGSFGVEFIPGRGTAINFTIHLTPADSEGNPVTEDTLAPLAYTVPGSLALEQNGSLSTPLGGARPNTPRASQAVSRGDCIVIADMASSGRKNLIRRLEGLPHILLEVRDTAGIIKACGTHDLGLIITDAELPEIDLKNALKTVQNLRAESGRANVPVLGMISYDEQRPRMMDMGCSTCLLKTCDNSVFRQTVLELAPDEETLRATAVQEPFVSAMPSITATTSVTPVSPTLSVSSASVTVGPHPAVDTPTFTHTGNVSASAEKKGIALLSASAEPPQALAPTPETVGTKQAQLAPTVTSSAAVVSLARPMHEKPAVVKPDVSPAEEPQKSEEPDADTANQWFKPGDFTQDHEASATEVSSSTVMQEAPTPPADETGTENRNTATLAHSDDETSRSLFAEDPAQHYDTPGSTPPQAAITPPEAGAIANEGTLIAVDGAAYGHVAASEPKKRVSFSAVQPTPPSRPNPGFTFTQVNVAPAQTAADADPMTVHVPEPHTATPEASPTQTQEAPSTTVSAGGGTTYSSPSPQGGAKQVLGLSIKGFDPVALAMPDAIGAPGEHTAAQASSSSVGQPRPAAATTPQEGSKQAPLIGLVNEYVDASLLPLLPGFVLVLEDSLKDIEKGIRDDDSLTVSGAASRISGQSATFGLTNLERMASCVERAAQASDMEAVRDLSEELTNMTTRYRDSLKETHKAYMRKASLGAA